MQNTGTGNILGFRKIGNFTHDVVDATVKKVCQQIGKSWDHLQEPERRFYLTTAANALANKPTILTQSADVPNIEGANLGEFQRLFLLEMRKLPAWNDQAFFNGLPVDLGEGRGVGSEATTESRR